MELAHVHLHFPNVTHIDLCDLLDMRHTLSAILSNVERLTHMSDTFHADLTAQTAAIQALAAEVQTGLAANAAAIQALKDQIASGTPVTADDLAALEGNTKAIQDATAALQTSLNPPVEPPPTV